MPILKTNPTLKKRLMILFSALTILSFSLTAISEVLTKGNPDSANEKWDHVFIQRTGHHVSLTAGYFASSWLYPNGKKYRHDYLLHSISYTYHLPVIKHFAIFLGSSIGYAVDLQAEDKNIKGSSGKLILPGFLVGLSLSFSTRIKANLGAHMAWSRSMGLNYKGDNYQFNMRTIPEVYLGLDYFFSSNWAFTASANYRREIFLIDNDDIRRNLKVFYGSTREAFGFLLGVTFHKL